jgi:PTS system galactitol-specific IIC component
MQSATGVFHYIQERLDVSIVTIVFIVGLGVCFGLPASKAVRAGLTAGVGFIGLELLLGMFWRVLEPSVQSMVENYGLSAGVVDIGEAPVAAVVSASQIGAMIVPLGIALNLLMLATNTTRTINIDVLSFRYCAFTGAMAQRAAGSYPLGLAAAAFNMVIVTVIADRMGRRLEKHAGLHGISMPHGFSAAFIPVAFVMNKIVGYLPGINRLKADMNLMQKRLGIAGDPVVIGVAFGFLITLLGKLGAVPMPDLLFDSLLSAVQVGAVFMLAPKTAAFLMEGAGLFADAARAFMGKRFKYRDSVYIGMNALVGLGHPLVLTATLILTPLSIFLAVILPGNRMLPFAGLAFIPYILVSVIPITGGAFFRSLLVGALTMAVMLYCGSGVSEILMSAAADAEAEIYANYMGSFSSIHASNPLTLALLTLSRLKWTGLAIIAVISIGLAMENRSMIIKEGRRRKSAKQER